MLWPPTYSLFYTLTLQNLNKTNIMKSKNQNLSKPLKLAATLLLLGCSTTLHAQTILGVDFGSANNPVEQTDFDPFSVSENATAGPVTKSYTGLDEQWTADGTVAVTLAAGTTITATNNMLARNRSGVTPDSGSFTYNALYRDLIIAQNRPDMRIGISGLNANTTYDVRLFAYDQNESGTMLFTNETGTGSETASISWTASFDFANAGTDADTIFSAVLRLQTDSEGNLLIGGKRTDAGGAANRQAIIDGMQITAIPEPASVGALIGACAVALAFSRRGKRRG